MAASSDVPHNASQWTQKARDLKVIDTSIHDIQCRNSASKFSEEQYIALRVLWTNKTQDNFEDTASSKGWLTNGELKGCKELKTGDWKDYLRSIREKANRRHVGMFTLVRYCQHHVITNKEEQFEDPWDKVESPVSKRTRAASKAVLSTPSKQSKTPYQTDSSFSESLDMSEMSLEDESILSTSEKGSASSPMPADSAASLAPPDDEQITNTALLLFLHAVTFDDPEKPNWTIRRRRFRCGEQFEARTDGYLCKGNDEVRAIIEVKPRLRSKDIKKTRMQESAQMAAWIYDEHFRNQMHKTPSAFDANGKMNRLLVSQNHKEIYLTIAEYDADYVTYLEHSGDDGPERTKNARTSLSFLIMYEHGPFLIDDSNHMKSLGRHISSLTRKYNR